MPNRRSDRLMNRGRAPIPEPAEPNGGRGGNNRGCGCGGIPFNLENTPPPIEENLPPPPPPNLAEVIAQQTQLLAALVEGANRRHRGQQEKLYYYHKGLNPHIKLKFGGIESNTLHALVDRCIQIEKDRAEAGEEYRERKHKPE